MADDARTYETDVRVTVVASSKLDARDTLDECCTRLFGEECLVSIAVPESVSFREVGAQQQTTMSKRRRR
jgi:hypothetical protein